MRGRQWQRVAGWLAVSLSWLPDLKLPNPCRGSWSCMNGAKGVGATLPGVQVASWGPEGEG